MGISLNQVALLEGNISFSWGKNEVSMWSKQKSPRFAAEKTSNPVGGSQGDHGTSRKSPMAPWDSKRQNLGKMVDFSVCFLNAKEN